MEKDSMVLVGCPLPPSFRADSRTIGMLEAWNRASNVVTYYPATGSAECGQDAIVQFAKRMIPRPSHILFVDYDVLPRANTLTKLMNHDKDIVSGVYPTTQKCEISWCLSRDVQFKLMPILELPKNPFKVHVVSNGMMLVKMEVFDNLEWPYWRTEYAVGMTVTGADIYFCRKAKAAGYDLWVDPKLKCNHFKMVDLLGIAKTYIKEK